MFEFDNVGSRDSCRDFVGNGSFRIIHLLHCFLPDLVLVRCYVKTIYHILIIINRYIVSELIFLFR
jgi:hypothetical protein